MNMKKITIKVKKQWVLNLIPKWFEGDIVIIGGTEEQPINITKHYPNAEIRLKENSVVNLYDDTVVNGMWDNSIALNMHDNSRVEFMHENSTVVNMHDNSRVENMWDNSKVQNMHGNASVEEMWYYSTIENMQDNSTVGQMLSVSTIQNMRDNATVKQMWDNSTVFHMNDNATVGVVYSSNVKVTANGNNTVNVSKHLDSVPGITVNKTSKIVKLDTFYSNQTPEFFVQQYNIPVIDGKVLLYKAVHKNNDGGYYSEYNNEFTYKIGETIINDCNTNVNKTCSFGLHVGTLEFAKEFGKYWTNCAILECEVELSKLVVPMACDGKVRTSEIKVIREIK